MNNWTDEVEILLKKLRLNSILLVKYHKASYLRLTNMLKYFRIPVIVLSGVSSVFNVLLKELIPYDSASMVCSFISLSVGLIGSIEMFLQLQHSIETDHTCIHGYGLIITNITKMISLSRENRTQDAMTFLDEISNAFNKLREISVVKDKIDNKILDINIITNITENDELKIINDKQWISKYSKILLNLPQSIGSSITLTPRRQSPNTSPQVSSRKNSSDLSV